MFKKALSVAVCGLVLVAGAVAQDVLGKWSGKLTVDWSKVPKMDDPEMKKQIEQAKKMLDKIKTTLEVKADKTYKSAMTGTEQGNTNAEGTWVFAGDTLTLNPKKRNGKVVTGEEAKPRKLILSKDKKTLSMKMPGSGEVTLVFTRG